MAPTILITRAEPAAVEFADALRRRLGCGVDVVISPLMRIATVSGVPKCPDAFASLIFTSRNAVEAFADMTTRRDWPSYCVGEATAAAARAAGFSAVSAGGTVQDLADMLRRDRPETPCLYLRGEHVASDLAATLSSAAIETVEAVIYRQLAQPLTDEARALLNRENPVILPLFSPRSAHLFFDQDTGAAPLFVASISENTATAVPADRAAILRIAKTPTATAVLDALEGLLDAANRLEGGKGAQ